MVDAIASNRDKALATLRMRAERLAQPIINESEDNSFLEILVFKLSQEKYAIETKYIREVDPLRDYTHLPGTPSFIFGLINVRRKIVTVVDLKSFFNLSQDSGPDRKVVILESQTKAFALITDGIIGIDKANKGAIQATLPTLAGVRQDFLQGITADGIVILDANKLMNSKTLVVDEAIELT